MQTAVTTPLIKQPKKTLALIASVFFVLSCSKYEKVDSPNTYSRMDVAATEAAFSAINSSLMESEGSFLNATCDTSVTFRTCALYANPDYRATYNWNSCTFDNSKISFSGIWRSYYYDDTGASCSLPIAVGKETSRLTTTDPVKYHISNGDTVEMFTLQSPAFPGQPLNAYGIKTLQFDANTRKLRIDNMQVTRKSAGQTLYDIYLFSGATDGTTQIDVTGKLSTSNRVVNGFTYAFFKEQARVKVNFNSAIWSDAACCYPKSGTMSLEFDSYNSSLPTAWPSTGKTAIVQFTNTCGEATITGTDGLQSDYTFSECF